jgi:VWFA-related protein
MTRHAAVAVTVVLLTVLASAQQTFRSGVDVVRVDALVTDGRKPIGGLTAGDFELRDNGVVQPLDSVALEALPLSVTFVLDTSGSVAGDKMRHLYDAVDAILQRLRDEDRAALVTFSHRVWLRTPPISDFAALRRMMVAAAAGGGTALHDAVYTALVASEAQDSRALLLVFSDGLDNMSWMGADVVERAARRANAVVYGVAVAAASGYRTDARDRTVPFATYARGQTDFLDKVADATGGRVVKADSIDTLRAAFDDILTEFRTRYVLTYSPRGVSGPGWHAIAVRVKGRNADVKARAGYQK